MSGIRHGAIGRDREEAKKCDCGEGASDEGTGHVRDSLKVRRECPTARGESRDNDEIFTKRNGREPYNPTQQIGNQFELMPSRAAVPRVFRVGDLEIDPVRGDVRRQGAEIYLRQQSFELLLYLVSHRDRLVGKDELHEQIWRGVAVSDDAIVQCVADIRRALGDDARAPRFVRTVAKRGYRFVAPVEEIDPLGPVEPVAQPAHVPQVSRRSPKATPTVLLVAVLAMLAMVTRPAGPAAVSVTGDLEAYRHYVEGIEHSRALRPADAVAAFERAVARDPQFALAHARIGYVYAVRHAQLDRARPHLTAALAGTNRLSDRERLRVTAWLAIAEQAYDQAIAATRALLDRYPDDVETAVELVTLLHGEGRLDEALAVAQRAAAVAPDDRSVLNVLGSSASLLGRHDEAVTAQRRQIALSPASANALDSLGMALQWAGRYEEAIESYQHATEMDPGFEVAWFHLGNTLAQLGRYDGARGALDRAIAAADFDEDRARGHVLAVLVNLRRGDLTAAEAHLARAQALSGRVPPEAALVALGRGDRSAALDVLRQSIGRGAARGSGQTRRFEGYWRSLIAELEQRPEDMLAHLKSALLHPPPIYAFDSHEDALGHACLRQGRFAEAVAEFERVLRLNPRYPSALFGLAQALEGMGEAARAREKYSAFLDVWREADADAPDLLTARRKVGAADHQAAAR